MVLGFEISNWSQLLTVNKQEQEQQQQQNIVKTKFMILAPDDTLRSVQETEYLC